MDRGGDDHLVQPGRHELQGHDLGEGVLEGDAVRVDVDVGPARPGHPVAAGAQVADQDLLGQGERPSEARAALGHPAVQPLVEGRRVQRSLPAPGRPRLVAVARRGVVHPFSHFSRCQEKSVRETS